MVKLDRKKGSKQKRKAAILKCRRWRKNKSLKRKLIRVPTLNICWTLKWTTLAGAPVLAVLSQHTEGGCLLQPYSSQDYFTTRNFCCNSLAVQVDQAMYQMAHLHSRAGVKTLSTQTPFPPAADHKQQGFPLKAVNRNFGGVNPSAFQKWYQHLTNVQQLPAGETSKQADKVEGRVLFWLCKNFLAWDATDRFAMAAQQKADSLYTVNSLVWSKEFLPFP